MKNLLHILFLIIIMFTMSCASSNIVSSNGVAISKYKYIVFGKELSGDAELEDLIMIVENKLSSKLIAVSPTNAADLLAQGEKIVSPRINVKSEKWDGGHTYISVVLHDYETNQNIAVIKSSGIGLSIKQDQKLALKKILKEIDALF